MYSDERGPRLVPGYGESVWRQNVALVQSSQSALNRLFAAPLDRDTAAMVGFTDMENQPTLQPLTSTAMQAVDPEFVALLSDRTRIDL